MNNTELVSIIMPMYNCEGFAAQSIESVLAQTYQNWELLIVDDISTDNSLEVAKRYADRESRIRLLTNEKNSGAAISRNHALREAKGKWIAFLDSDDLWQPQKLEKQINFMEQNGCHFSYTQYEEIDDNGVPTGTVWTGPSKVGKARMFAYDYLGCLTVMYDRKYVGLIQIPSLKKCNDYAMWLKVVRFCPCYLLAEPLAKYRVRTTGSITDRKAGVLRKVKFYYEMYRKSENMGSVRAMVHTGINLVFGAIKKIVYRRVE